MKSSSVRRSKILAIPYVKGDDGKPLFLAVKDKKFDEWTFVSGTCKKKSMEHPMTCAIRELKEETKECVDIDLHTWPHAYMSLGTTWNEPSSSPTKNQMDVYTTYHIYVLDITEYARSPSSIIHGFFDSKMTGKQFNENTDIGFFSIDDLRHMKLWKFISRIILDNEAFQNIISRL